MFICCGIKEYHVSINVYVFSEHYSIFCIYAAQHLIKHFTLIYLRIAIIVILQARLLTNFETIVFKFHLHLPFRLHILVSLQNYVFLEVSLRKNVFLHFQKIALFL